MPNPPKPKEPEYLTQIHIFEPAPEAKASLSITDEIVTRLRNFRIEQSTPMQCMLFLSQLQKELPYTLLNYLFNIFLFIS